MALNKKLTSALLFGLSTALAGNAFADISINVNDASGNVGNTVVVTYDYAALDADDAGGFQFDITYDPAALTPTDVTMCGNNRPATHNASCTEPGGAGNGTVRTLIADFTPPTDEIAPFNIASFGQITFQINQAGAHTLTFTGAVGSDIAGGNVNMTGNNATITGAIVGAAGFGSVPASGSTLTFGPVEVGSPTAAQNITVSETGDQTLDVTAIAFTTGTDFASGTAPFMIADGGASVDVDVTCTPTARGLVMDTLELTNNSVNDPNPQYSLECSGTSPNVAVNPLTINLAGVIGGTNPSDTFDITNAQDGFTSDALNAALAESGTAEISITAGLTDGTISVDETDSVTVECSTAAAGMFTETISLTYDDAAAAGGTNTIDVTVNCDIANAFPVYESVPTPGSTIDFMTVTNGTVSAPLGVDVGNSGAVGGATLNVTAAALSGANAAQFDLTFAPFTVPAGQAPDGTNDITITCSPDTVGMFTATLTVNTDDPAEPAGGFTYPLACEGVSDAGFDSNPAAPGPINFGVLFPGANSDETIIFSNTGTVDDLTVDSCTLTADPEFTLVAPAAFPQTIAAGGTLDIVLNCAVAAPGLFSGTLSCVVNDAQGNPVATPTFDLACTGQPLVIPTLSQWGLLAMALLLLFAGAIAFRLRSN
ncbi:MAG: hypothetical protein Tsb002_06940 [Wenzhouxiangellaceae bacterium]